MKRGHYVIIGGAALFVAGIAVVIAWALPIAAQIIKETSTLQGEQLAAGQSKTLTLEVADTSRPLSIIVNSANKDAELAVVLVTPDGQRAIESTFKENTVLSADPAVAGTYELTVTNSGELTTSIDVVFGRVPGVEENNQVNVDVYGGVVAGVGIVVAGIMVMIAGVIVVVIDRRKKPVPTG